MKANPAEDWNTILQSHAFYDIRPHISAPSSALPAHDLLGTILRGALPLACQPAPPCGECLPADSPDIHRQTLKTALHQNVPNPFNPLTTIRFDLARAGLVRLRVYDVTGRRVRSLVDARMLAGRHPIVWDGLDDSGARVASGIYLYRLETEDHSATRKLVVMR